MADKANTDAVKDAVAEPPVDDVKTAAPEEEREIVVDPTRDLYEDTAETENDETSVSGSALSKFWNGVLDKFDKAGKNIQEWKDRRAEAKAMRDAESAAKRSKEEIKASREEERGPDTVTSSRRRRRSGKVSSAEAAANTDKKLDAMKDAFAKADVDASTDPQTGDVSKSKKVLKTLGKATGATLSFTGSKLAHFGADFKRGVQGMLDSRRERHGQMSSDTLLHRYGSEAILAAANEVNAPEERLRQALDVVHQNGYVTAGGAAVMEDLAQVDRLRSRGYGVTMPAAIENVVVPDAVKGKLDVTLRVNNYDGVGAAPEPKSIADQIREDLGEGAKRGQSKLVDETVDAIAQIKSGYNALQKLADRDDLPDDFKQFIKDSFPKWSKELGNQDEAVGKRLREVSGMDEAAPQPAPAEALVDDDDELDDLAEADYDVE